MSREPGSMRDAAGVAVEAVAKGSPAERAGIAPGDRILAVSGEKVNDLLDFHFLTSGKRFRLRWAAREGGEREKGFSLKGPLGIHPEPIRVRRCRNRCIFCFVHQLPKGLRRNLYIKDEDVRLSFLHGQYVTFSDVTEDEIRKIVRYRLSPLYVSIHTTEPDLRRRMLGNPRAADVNEVLRTLVGEGIELHGQIVVVPGVNDGKELERSLRDLARFRPGLATVAVVPVGLTAHREGLPPIRPVTPSEAKRTLRMLVDIEKEIHAPGEEPFAQAADEYYLLAGVPIPGKATYGTFAQIGNGVGLLRRFLDESGALFRKKRWGRASAGGTVISGFAPMVYVTDFVSEFSVRAEAGFELLPVANRLFGKSVTVTGLLGGEDIARALKRGKNRTAYLPSVVLRDAGDLFLDGWSPRDVEREAGVEVRLFEPTPRGFYRAVYGEKSPYNR